METVLDKPVNDAIDNRPSAAVASECNQKYLTFMLADEEYGLEILKVREIIGIMEISKVPQAQGFVSGVINLRGKVIPVIDLRKKFQLPPRDYNEQTCVIVVDVGTPMGIVVDTVCEVHDIPTSNVSPPPKLGHSTGTDFILGMGKVNEEVKILLDIERVLTDEELVEPLEVTG